MSQKSALKLDIWTGITGNENNEVTDFRRKLQKLMHTQFFHVFNLFQFKQTDLFTNKSNSEVASNNFWFQ